MADVNGRPASEEIQRLALRVRVATIMTPESDLVFAPASATAGEALARMGNRFDQLPLGRRGGVAGLVFRRDLEGCDPSVPASGAVVLVEALPAVRPEDPVRIAIERLVEHPCLVVRETASGRFRGIVHYSDLNKHAVRSNTYLWISALEMGLARLVRRRCPDFEEWLRVLDENRQILILGRFELERRRRMELDPIEATDLSDLLKIVRLVPRLLEAYGMSKKQFEKTTGHLVRIRHAAMHPVRSVVRSHEDLRNLADVWGDLVAILDATYRALGDERAGERVEEP